MDALYFTLFGLVSVVIGFGLGWLFVRRLMRSKLRNVEREVRSIREDAVKEAESDKKEKLIEVKEEWYRQKEEFEEQTKNVRLRLQNEQDQIRAKDKHIEQKADLIDKKEQEVLRFEKKIKDLESDLSTKHQKLELLIEEHNLKLEHVANLTPAEAKEILMNNMVERAQQEAAQTIRDIKEQAEISAKDQARKIVLSAIERTAVDHYSESTVSIVRLPGDEMKGRIIGRDGRNIRSFESATGVDVLIDDTPCVIVISSFDSIRREIARLSLEKLVMDGRIHPGRIEDVVEKSRSDFEENIVGIGEEALFETSVHGVHPDIIRAIGRMKFKTSVGQNLLNHSIEVAHLAGIMAAELGLDVNLAKRAGLLHDIGYVVEKNLDTPHTIAGVEFARRYNEGPVVQNAIQSHHESVPPEHPICVLVATANQLSLSRPGARRKTLETYINKLSRLEEIIDAFDGVSKSYVIQAGREVRIMVNHELVSDADCNQLADEVVRRVEQEIQYPGQIKINLIREVRAIGMAK